MKNDRQKKGFFLTKVTYDDRANKAWVEDDYYKNYINGDPSTAGYYMYDWSASLTPTDEIDYRSREKTFNVYLHLLDQSITTMKIITHSPVLSC